MGQVVGALFISATSSPWSLRPMPRTPWAPGLLAGFVLVSRARGQEDGKEAWVERRVEDIE